MGVDAAPLLGHPHASASMRSSASNLANAIIGAGILAMPYAVAERCFQ